jgi:hypothetical protein
MMPTLCLHFNDTPRLWLNGDEEEFPLWQRQVEQTWRLLGRSLEQTARDMIDILLQDGWPTDRELRDTARDILLCWAIQEADPAVRAWVGEHDLDVFVVTTEPDLQGNYTIATTVARPRIQ